MLRCALSSRNRIQQVANDSPEMRFEEVRNSMHLGRSLGAFPAWWLLQVYNNWYLPNGVWNLSSIKTQYTLHSTGTWTFGNVERTIILRTSEYQLSTWVSSFLSRRESNHLWSVRKFRLCDLHDIFTKSCRYAILSIMPCLVRGHSRSGIVESSTRHPSRFPPLHFYGSHFQRATGIILLHIVNTTIYASA